MVASSSLKSIRRHLAVSVVTVAVLAGGVGGWAATSEIAGAVIASGLVVVESNVKKVQHPTGGIVAALLVKDGSRVKAGEPVLRLDDVQARASMEVVRKQLDELAGRQARSEAERDQRDTIEFPASLLLRTKDPTVARIVDGERHLFEVRRAARGGEKAQLREQIIQLNEQIQGHTAQQQAKSREIEWIRQELVGVRELWEKQLVQFQRVTSLERDAARIEGERGQLIASVAQAKGRVAETELKILQIDQELRSQVGRELADVRAKTSELQERMIASEDLLRRVEVMAPIAGMVLQLSVHTIGGVIAAGETIMTIVPSSDLLNIEARIGPAEIDQVAFGQAAVLRFTNFNMQTTPEIRGTVAFVSPDISVEQKTGATYYTAKIDVSLEELARLGDVKLIPGMPVEVFIQTKPRTVLSYLIRPIQDQVERAFREK